MRKSCVNVVFHRFAGGVVVRRRGNCVEFLLLEQIRKNGDIQWVMPKGHVQKSETSEMAAVREVREETGIEELQLIAPLGNQEFRYYEKDDTRHQKTVSWYLMETPYESHLSINIEEEFVKAKWLQYEETRIIGNCRCLIY